MDVDTAHCAFRLLSMLEAKHPFVRNLDPFTKRTIILITQSSPHLKPSNYATLFKSVRKESFQQDLAFLADRLVNQTLRPLSSPPVTSLALAEIDPLTRNVSLHSTSLAIPSLPEIRKSVRDTIDECFRNTSHNPNFTEARILDALKQLPTEQQNQIRNLREQLRDAQEEARLYRTRSSATTNTLLSSASSAPSEPKSEHKEIKCFSCEEIGHFGEDCLCTSKHRQPSIRPRSPGRRPGIRSQNLGRSSQRGSKRDSLALSIEPTHLEPPIIHRDLDLYQPLYELSTTPHFQAQNENLPQHQNLTQSHDGDRHQSGRHHSHSERPHSERNHSRMHSSRDSHRTRDLTSGARLREITQQQQQQPTQHPPVQTIKETRMRAWDGSRRPVPAPAINPASASNPTSSSHIENHTLGPAPNQLTSTALAQISALPPVQPFSTHQLVHRKSSARLSLGARMGLGNGTSTGSGTMIGGVDLSRFALVRTVMAMPVVQRVMAHPLELAGAVLGLIFGSFVAGVGRGLWRGVWGTARFLHGAGRVVLKGGEV